MTDLMNKLPVEPLSDARWRTIEEGLFDQLELEPVSMPAVLTANDARPRRSRRTMATLAFAAAATAAALLLLGVVLRDLGRGEPTARIATDAAGSRLAFGDADIDVSPNSVVLLRGDAETGVLAVIERGEARFSVAPRQNRPPFAVAAGEVRVEVVGTIFSVSREGELAKVTVTEGKVRVRHRSEQAMVTTGQVWTPGATLSADADADATPTDAAAPARQRLRRTRDPNRRSGDSREVRGADSNSDELVVAIADGEDSRASDARSALGGAGPELDLDDHARDDDSTWTVRAPDGADIDDDDGADLNDGNSGGDDLDLGDGDSADRKDASDRSTRRKQRSKRERRQRAKRAQRARRERARQARRERAEQTSDVELPPPVAQTTADSAGDRYLRAAELEASSPGRALDLYRELAGENNEWSEVALFAWGRLELERGNKSAASRLLRRYLARYPRGRNRADAEALLEDADD